jgi:UDP-N-acetylglucosamine 2-epimerase
MKIISIVGARPQFIKYFSIYKAFKSINALLKVKIKDILIHTGQHYDFNMSDIFFEELHIKEPDYYLGVGSWSHGKQIAEIIKKAEDILVVESPEAVLVYGDTNSTLGGALASKINNIPVVHIESGMRSYNKAYWLKRCTSLLNWEKLKRPLNNLNSFLDKKNLGSSGLWRFINLELWMKYMHL